MKMLSLSTYSQARIHRPNSGLNGFPSPNSLVSSKHLCTSTNTRILLMNARATGGGGGGGGGAAAGQGMLGNNPIPHEEKSNPFMETGLIRERMPKHVGLSLDGNRKWSLANNGGQLTYEPFYRKYILLADLCVQWGIPAASCFIFATCTWKRTAETNNLMFTQFQASLLANLEKFMREGIRVSVLGEKWRLPNLVQNAIKQVEEATKNGTVLDFRYTIPYGGRWDIVEAARSLSKKVKEGEIKPADISEASVERELSTGIFSVPNPDLMIRYGGKHRISNFYVWQSSHAELYFNDVLGPEFEESGFIDALRWFQQCGRRFGK